MRFYNKFRSPAFAGIFLLVLLACAGAVYGPAWSGHEKNGTATVTEPAASEVSYYPVTIRTGNGAVLIQAELADTPETRRKGLMGRTSLPDGYGMLFLFPVAEDVAFWMRGTLIPLDILYIDKDGKIIHIHPMAVPLDETPLPSRGPVKAVLEIAGGQAAAKGIKTGDRIVTDLLEKEIAQ